MAICVILIKYQGFDIEVDIKYRALHKFILPVAFCVKNRFFKLHCQHIDHGVRNE